MYRSMLCLIAFVGLSSVELARLQADAITWFALDGATLDGQPIDPGVIQVVGGTIGFPSSTQLDITTTAGPGLYQFTVRFEIWNDTPFRIDAWNLSVGANSAVTLESFDPIGPFVLSDGPFNTLPATGPGLILDSGGQVGIGAGDGVWGGSVDSLAIMVFSTELAPADPPQTHEITAGIGQWAWEPPLINVRFADNAPIPVDAVNTFAPNPVIRIHQIPEPSTLVLLLLCTLATQRLRRR